MIKVSRYLYQFLCWRYTWWSGLIGHIINMALVRLCTWHFRHTSNPIRNNRHWTHWFSQVEVARGSRLICSRDFSIRYSRGDLYVEQGIAFRRWMIRSERSALYELSGIVRIGFLLAWNLVESYILSASSIARDLVSRGTDCTYCFEFPNRNSRFAVQGKPLPTRRLSFESVLVNLSILGQLYLC